MSFSSTLASTTTFRHISLAASASVLTLGMAIPASSQTLFVSTAGHDSANGSQAAPVASLAQAIALARERHAHSIVIESGVYRLTSSLLLGPNDSGLSIAAAPGAQVTLSGGRRIVGWKLIDAKSSLWSAPFPADFATPRQIYIDGVRANRASGRLPVAVTMNAHGYTAATDALSHWRRPQDLEFVYTGGNSVWGEASVGLGSWTEPRCPVAAIHGTEIVMAEPCWTNSTARIMLPSGRRTANLVGPASIGKHPAYMDNAYELLGRPGEFYADPSTHTLYYIPRSGEDLHHADVEAPALESLLSINGSEQAPVHNITVDHINFVYASWQAPSSNEGFSEIQANYRVTGADGATKQALCQLVPDGTCPFASWTPEPGGVSTHFADHLHFRHDSFTHLGAAGLSITDGAHQNLVEGCTFTDISGNGLELADVNGPMAADAAFAIGNRIENNLFRDVGAEFRGGIPIVVGYAQSTHIAHNQIDHVPYAGISIGWGGWMDKIELPGVANRSTRNVIEDNLIQRFMLDLSDGGGIYTQGRTGKTLGDGELVQGNVVLDQYSSGHAIYSDNGSSLMTIRGNVMFNTNHDNWGSRHRDFYDGADGKQDDPLLVEDNWWQQGDPDSSAKQVTEQGNHLISDVTQVPSAVMDNAGLQPAFRDLIRPLAHVPPEAPAEVGVFETPGKAYITWRPPVFDGGDTVKSYVVRSSDGSLATISAADFDRLSYARLNLSSSLQPRTFTVTAINTYGESPSSIPSQPAVPADDPSALPGSPQSVSAHVQGTRASIHFSASQDHGEHVLAYSITIQPGGRKEIFTGRRLLTLEGRHVTFVSLDGLTPGITYRFGVAAINPAGEGQALWTTP